MTTKRRGYRASNERVQRRVLLVGRCRVCNAPIELVAGCEWVRAGTWEACDHAPRADLRLVDPQAQ